MMEGMAIVLVNHVGEHVAGTVLTEGFVANTGATPRHLFPDHEAELIAKIEHQAVLLVVGQADEVGAHVADELHFLADLIVAHCGGEAGMVDVAVTVPRNGSTRRCACVELEGAMLDELDVARTPKRSSRLDWPAGVTSVTRQR